MASKSRRPRGRSFAVRRSGIHGKGVFALRDIKKGSEIVYYKGKLITHEECARLYDGEDDGHTFLFTLNETYVIDGAQGGNSARWINHACQPNCEALTVESEEKNPRADRIVIEAKRDIPAGTELTYDYCIELEETLTPALKQLWACRCGSKRCRGTLFKI